MQVIESARLRLRALGQRQLGLCLNDLSALKRELNLSIARDVIDGNVIRALNMKIKKMETADVSRHQWFTYWLIVIKEDNAGVGLVGFKGQPDATGSVEIGYGIAGSYQERGFMSEAVRAMVGWALEQAECQCVTATGVTTNPTSRRLLEKLGAQLVGQNIESGSWRINRK